MVLKIVIILLAVVLLAIIINGAKDYCKQKKRENMYFREAMDLVELPVITFYNNDKKFNFLLDTGATLSVIDSSALKQMKYEELDGTGTIFGMEGNKIDVGYVDIDLKYKKQTYTDSFQVVDMSLAFDQVKAESGVTLSGILGSLFFKKYQYVLDFNDLIAYSKK